MKEKKKKINPKKPLPDHVSLLDPVGEILPTTPISTQRWEARAIWHVPTES